ncbi:LuxR C-terminal-related transcriptional regulator [Kitasatospora sp. NPDC051853]|uniref:helix-turn-helix transcriptional regulator n=1 Tax=Kitasatospora sp. NPDC051853 TaxID=3364058 RepID=UPI0037B8B7EE
MIQQSAQKAATPPHQRRTAERDGRPTGADQPLTPHTPLTSHALHAPPAPHPSLAEDYGTLTAALAEDSTTLADARELYRRALADPEWDPSPARARLGWDDDRFIRAIELLDTMGLLAPAATTPSGWTTLSPTSAISRLLADEERRVSTRLAEAAAARHTLARLLTDFHPLHADQLSGAATELVIGPARVTAMLEDVVRRARSDFLSLHPGPPVAREMLEAGLSRDKLLLERGVTIRSVHLGSSAATPALHGYLAELSWAGARVRTAQTLPMRMILVDGSLAVLPAPAVPDEIAALVVHGEQLVAVFRQLFEHCWSLSADFAPTHTGPAAPDPDLTERHHEILRMLASGLTDESMARRLAVSERTIRRLVAEITQRLGADSRFQAGVIATQLGWLDQTTPARTTT